MAQENFISEVIAQVIEDLQANPAIIINELTINHASPAEELDAIEKLPGILREFYEKTNGLVLSWYVADDPAIKGGIVMPLLENIYATRWKAFGYLDFTEDVHTLFSKKEAFDSRVMMESLQGDEDIEFTGLGGSIVTIEEYFNAFAQTRGFRFWQENYSSEVEYTVDSIIEHRAYLWGSGETAEVPETHSAHFPS